MRVLITGATTPLGATLVDHLLAEPEVELVLAVGREPMEPSTNPRLHYRSIDLTRPRAVHDLVHGEALVCASTTSCTACSIAARTIPACAFTPRTWMPRASCCSPAWITRQFGASSIAASRRSTRSLTRRPI